MQLPPLSSLRVLLRHRVPLNSALANLSDDFVDQMLRFFLVKGRLIDA